MVLLATPGRNNVVTNPAMDPNVFGTLPYVLDHLVVTPGVVPTVTFNINNTQFGQPADVVIQPTAVQPIPQLNTPVLIDGLNLFNNRLITLQGPGAGAGVDGFVITTAASGTTIERLNLAGFGNAIDIEGNNNIIVADHLGFISSTAAPGNAVGVLVHGANNVIGQTSPLPDGTQAGNEFGGNTQAGLLIDGPNANNTTVQNNVFGVTFADTNGQRSGPFPNANGIVVSGGDGTLIGTEPTINPSFLGNLIVNSTGDGIAVGRRRVMSVSRATPSGSRPIARPSCPT